MDTARDPFRIPQPLPVRLVDRATVVDESKFYEIGGHALAGMYRAYMTGTTDGQPEAEGVRCEDGSVLSRISTEMVRTMKQYYGKGPVSAKSYLVDDLLFVVMREGITQAEQTMLDAGRAGTVRNFRQEFENEMAEVLTRMVERVTGRRVVTYQSQVLFDPNLTIEIFVFDDGATPGRGESDDLIGAGNPESGP
jgi:uncharacterized protein YbcI